MKYKHLPEWFLLLDCRSEEARREKKKSIKITKIYCKGHWINKLLIVQKFDRNALPEGLILYFKLILSLQTLQ